MNPHDGQPVIRGGAVLQKARAVLILIHGRGGSAEDILSLGEELSSGISAVTLLAPQAAAHTWYPQRFFAPLAQNEPYLSSGLGVIGRLLNEAMESGVAAERVALIGFSQGACLALEFAYRNPRKYGGVVGLSGALIGPPGQVRERTGSLEGSPVYLGCSDRDVHIPLFNVEQSAAVFSHMGARVTKSIFPGMGHTVNAEEITVVRALVQTLAQGV